METRTTLDKRAIAALAKSRNISTSAVHLLLRTKEMLLLGKAALLAEWRESDHRFAHQFAEHSRAELKTIEQREELDILRGRLRRMLPAQRKRYSPEERFRIVEFVRTYSLSHVEAAERFLVDSITIGRWISEATREPDAKTVGSLLKATPPLRTKSDVTRRLVAMLDEMKVGGSKTIAQMLIRAGHTIGRETVRRFRKAPRPSAPTPPDPTPTDKLLIATAPNHVWMTDITTIASFLKAWMLKVVVVLDVYSRFPVAFRVFWSEPSSAEIAEAVREAIDRHGKPKHFVTDQGSQFKGQAFAGLLSQHGILHRFGAVGRSGSIAIIERFWRTLKEMLDVRFRPPLHRAHLEERVGIALKYYATLRPHQGLDGATPADVYFGHSTKIETLRHDVGIELPFKIVYADPERLLPHLVPTADAA